MRLKIQEILRQSQPIKENPLYFAKVRGQVSKDSL